MHHLLTYRTQYKCHTLLKHPLVEVWLTYKWESYTKWIAYTLLFLRVVSVAIFSSFVLEIINFLLSPELPSVQPVSAEVLAVVGQEVKFSCEVTGHPSATLTWARPDQGLKPVTPLDPRIQAADSGVYTCQVKYPGGRLYREVEVVVEVPARLTILHRTAEVTQGERSVGPTQLHAYFSHQSILFLKDPMIIFVVKCKAVVVPGPSISWLLNAVEVIGAQVVDEGEVIP
ncbi:hypothetical protein Pcinc_007256 [Petrolisthes cinctipes]|uniref:Ig-like domain-containing protein n=1 Tax=Petrolisthes cinctipes TaxID=88211 RepID=A0AAE1G8W7_PETCI|nr:hypothetical protein Pcinc_007256 [Petrolisthes cinctipes]